ncbi:MAG TPA: hypothetical protein V6D48_08880 [Oculatellaceae cyanobacterium]
MVNFAGIDRLTEIKEAIAQQMLKVRRFKASQNNLPTLQIPA